MSADHFAERYRIEAVLGRGGMGSVSRVHDTQTGSTLALKQLLIPTGSPNPERRIALFQREYHILTQLSHPNVVRAFDYGLQADGPFYTMELLVGRSLRELAPLPWRVACGYLLDLCSALSVLHARGFVHRDLTPSNVVITEQGVTKLIDFGAMAPMGPNEAAVGTPPYMAPETLELAALDARADIFSLGALVYWALTGRHAYPAPTLGSLPEHWRRRPPPVSDFDREIPAALEQLVASMLNLSPSGRPSQIAEVTQRLSQALGQPAPPMAGPQRSAYLITPKLVGRSAELRLAASYAASAKLGRAALLMLTGEPGTGRTRLLEAMALEARLAGCLTLHVQANPASVLDSSLIRSLIASAVRQAPERAASAAAPHVRELEVVWPKDAAGELPSPTRISPEQQQVVVAFFARLQELSPLALCVDDVHLADLASLQVLGQLAHVSNQRLLIACSATPATSRESLPLARLRELAQKLVVRELEPAHTLELLGSMLGEPSGLEALARWVHQISEGRPATCLELVAHLISRGSIRWVDGSFELIASLDELDLPRSAEDVLLARWAGLSDAARSFLRSMSLCAHVCVPRSDMLTTLVAQRHGMSDAQGALGELLGQRLIKIDREHCSVVNPRLPALVLERSPEELQRELSRELADWFFAQGSDCWGYAAQCYRQAGDLERTQTILLGVDSPSVEADTPLALLARSPVGQKLYEDLLAYCKSRSAPPVTLHRFRKVMLQLAAVDAPELTRYAPETLEQLRYDIGLDCWDSFASTAEPMARLVQCFQVADQRWKSSDPARRGLEPSVALRELATCVALLVGAYAPIYDMRGLAALPGLIEPLRGLAPVLDIVYLLAKSVADSSVRGCFFVEPRQDLVRRLREPVAGMDRITQNGAYLLSAFYVELELAMRGSDRGGAVAEELEAHPMYAVLGKQLRLVAALTQGQFEATRRAREERELLSLQSTFTDQHRETSVRWEAVATYRAADLLGVKHLMRGQEARAARFAGVRPLLHLLHAQYLMLTDEPDRALAEVQSGQALAAPLQHVCWHELALLEMEALLALGRPAEAGACAAHTEALLRSVDFDPRYEDRLIATQARALAAVGDTTAAKARVNAAVQDFIAVNPNSVPVAALHEALAQIALFERDAAGFRNALENVERIYRHGKHPGLVARYERLLAGGGRVLSVSLAPGLERPHSDLEERILTVTQLRAGTPRASDEQLQQLLGIVLDEAAATSGYLYHWSDTGSLRQLAQRGGAPLNPILEWKLKQHLERLLSDDDEPATVTGDATDSPVITAEELDYVPIVLRDYDDPTRVLGLIAVSAREPVELGRGLLGMLGQTLRVLVANSP